MTQASSVDRRRTSPLAAVTPRRLRRRRALMLRSANAKKLEQIAKSGSPIVAGPWTGGVGMELLYWIPLLNWLTTKGGVERSRVVAVSRGGADSWYADVAGTYVDLLDHFEVAEVRKWHEERLRRPGNELHIGIHTHDHRAFQIAREAAGADEAEWLHPLLMHRLFAPRWEHAASGQMIWSYTVQRELPEVETEKPTSLPDSYVALKTYFSPAFPQTPENRAVLRRVIDELAARSDVVLLRAPIDAEYHEEYVPEDDAPVVDVRELLTPRTNLAVQTQIVRDARVLVATYGGFSYLGTYAGTPTVALYTRPLLEPAHVDAIDRVGRRLARGQPRLFRARHVGAIPAGSEDRSEPEPEGAEEDES